MTKEAVGREGTAPANQAGGYVRNLLLAAWVMLLSLFGVLLYPTVLLPAFTPVTGVLNAAGNPVGLDFVLLYGAGCLAREGRPQASYDDRALAEAQGRAAGTKIIGLRWTYPPGMLLVARALAGLPYLTALALWLGVGAGSLALVVGLVTRHPGPGLLLFLCPAATFAGMLNQTGLFCTALAGAGFLLLPRRPVGAGILLGVITLKLHLAILIPFCLLAARETRALVSFLASGAMLEVLGLIYVGTEGAHLFLAQASGAVDKIGGAPETLLRHPTVFSSVVLAGQPRLALAVQVLASLATLAVVWTVWRRSGELVARSLAWAAGLPLMVPYCFDYDLVVLVLPLAALAGRSAWGRLGWGQILAMSLLWSMPPLVLPMARWLGMQPGPMVLAGLLAYAAWLTRGGEPAGPGSKRMGMSLGV